MIDRQIFGLGEVLVTSRNEGPLATRYVAHPMMHAHLLRAAYPRKWGLTASFVRNTGLPKRLWSIHFVMVEAKFRRGS